MTNAPIRLVHPKKLKFIDLFAGIGGLRLGFEDFGHCVFTSEWNEKAQETYLANFAGDDHRIAGDITKVGLDEIPAHDLLLAGFPCQPFSISGVTKRNALGRPHGFECKTQGTLFFNVAQIIKHHKPRAFLLENVKNLQNHDRGRTFSVIMETLRDELRYDVHFRVLDAQAVVPQHRERIFIAGFREPVGFDFSSLVLGAPELQPKLGAILHGRGGPFEERFTRNDGRALTKYTLTKNLWKYLQKYAAKHKAQGNGFGYGLFGPDGVARTLSARYHKDGSEILIRQRGTRPRRLTPRECARLMGFDRPGREPFTIPVSDTQAYRQFGNAVVVPVVEAIARLMVPYIERVGEPTTVAQVAT